MKTLLYLSGFTGIEAYHKLFMSALNFINRWK